MAEVAPSSLSPGTWNQLEKAKLKYTDPNGYQRLALTLRVLEDIPEGMMDFSDGTMELVEGRRFEALSDAAIVREMLGSAFEEESYNDCEVNMLSSSAKSILVSACKARLDVLEDTLTGLQLAERPISDELVSALYAKGPNQMKWAAQKYQTALDRARNVYAKALETAQQHERRARILELALTALPNVGHLWAGPECA